MNHCTMVTLTANKPHRVTACGHMWLVYCVVIFLSQNIVESTDPCPVYANEAGFSVQNCSGKGLGELAPGQLSDQAEILDFSRNKFTSLPVIGETTTCANVWQCLPANSSYHCRHGISFSRNQINNFTGESLKGIHCLATLDLSFNELTAEIFHVDTFLAGVFHLETLLLNNNPLGRLPGNVITQPFMPRLRELDLSHCDLEEISKNGVDDFPELQTLNLSFNKLRDMHPKTFKVSRQRHVWPSELRELDLRENQLTYLPEDIFGDLVSLQVLQLSDNKIQGFHDKAFYIDSNLRVLNLVNNQLTSIPYSALNKLTKLQALDLSQNPIREVTRGSVSSSVQNLDLNNIPDLTHLGSYALASFPRLVSLSVSGNRALETIHPKFLGDNVAALKHLRLENNKLSKLTSDVLPWKQLAGLKLGGNPWSCDMDLEWMINAASIQDDVICAEPLLLKGQSLKTVSPGDLMRDYTLQSVTAIIVFSLCLPIVGVCAVLVWRRRRYCPCVKVTLKGQYVTLFTRDMDEEGGQRVDVELKVNGSKLSAISNGAADDTKPFIRIHKGKDRLLQGIEEEDA